MEPLSPAKSQALTQRALASLKIVSRLLSHELHAQSASKSITLSRDEVVEIQTVIDVYIEEASRRPGTQQSSGVIETAPPLAVARN
ncbi:MAG: hypothetical protein NTV21_12895 [Planctomycetota bacterium]|nr:hypothetical protein [Planctomycetota bacterium]